MKIALISDIHANFFYFERILHAIEKEKVDRIYCLGDIIGYYDKPNECIDKIRELNIMCIKGNHEKSVLKEISYDKTKDDVYRFQEQMKIMTNENIEFLKKLPDYLQVTIDGVTFYITHSKPNDSSHYLSNFDELPDSQIVNIDYYCFGHSHIPILTYNRNTCFINPGSVGQPRDFTQKPSYAVIDMDNNENRIVKVEVDVKLYTQYLRDIHFNTALINILER